MNTKINYEKYSNMTKRQLLNSLLNAEKKEAKIKADLQEKIKANSDLISFLKAKLKERIDTPKYEKEITIPSLDKAIAEFKNGGTEIFENFTEYKAKIDE